jgi:hypothetical protein
MRHHLALFSVLLAAFFVVGCNLTLVSHDAIVVNSLEDMEDPPEGTVTLRSALASAASGQPIIFDASLDATVGRRSSRERRS